MRTPKRPPAPRPDGTLLSVRVQPRASRDEIVGWKGDTLRVRVSAPPVEGEANMAIRRLVARTLGVAPASVELVRGDRSRDKVVRVAGLGLADIRARSGPAWPVSSPVSSFSPP
jgi:uncharacterized protein